MTSIIVSYSRKDSVIARKLIGAFEGIKLDVWVDWEDIPPAVGWLDQILRGIEASDAFIFLVSPDSIISEVCNVEIGHAGKNNKRIIPIVVRDVDPKTVNPIIRDLNWIFAREQDSFEEVINKIILAIELDLEWLTEHRRLQVRALEWHRKKEPSLLLRGRDLRSAGQMIKLGLSKDPKPTDLQQVYIHYSSRDERRRILLLIASSLALLIMTILSITAYQQSQIASAKAEEARQSELKAKENEAIAIDEGKKAREAEGLARKNENSAKAQRSAAKAQIYQSKTGELYTSTLLAIDSWQREPGSQEVEEILRKNISLLPVPVAQMSQSAQINALGFSPVGNTFITASADATTCGWNVTDGAKLFCATSSGSVNDATFSPNGEIIVTGDQSGQVLILDAKSGKVQKKLNFDVAVWNVDISPDSESLAVTRDDGIITIIDLNGRKADYELSTIGRPLISAFSPNGIWFASGSSSGGITLWNLKAGGAAITGPIHRGEVLALEFSPNSSVLVSGGADNRALVTLTRSGKLLFDINNQDRVEDLAFGPNGSWFVTASDDRSIRVWDTESGEEEALMLQEGFVKAVKVSPDGRWIATTGEDKTARVWNSATGAEMLQIPLKSSGSALAFSNDGKYLISGSQNGEINVWDISIMTAPVNEIQFRGNTGNVQFSPSGDWLAASDENRVWLLDKDQYSSLTTSPQENPILELDSDIKSLVISPNSEWIGVSTEQGELAIYNVKNRIRRIVGSSDTAQKLAFSPDSLQLITGSSDGKVQAWDVTTGKVTKTLFESNSDVMSLATSSELLAIGLTDKVMILNMNTDEVINDIESPGDHQLMAFNPQGSLLALSSSSGQISIWKQVNGEFTLDQSLSRGPVFSMTFNPQGDQLLIGERNIVYLIDILTGKAITRIPHKIPANSLSFSPDGKLFASALLKVIQFWDVTKIPSIDTNHLEETACSRIIQNFNKDEWKAFFRDEEYRPLCADLP